MKTPKHLIYTLLLMLSTTTLMAQADWQWGQEIRVEPQHIATDNFGNSYVTWSLQNNYTIDGENFESLGSSDAALTSFDCDGAHRWTKTIGGLGSDAAWGLGTDTLGGVYMACKVNGSIQENYSLNIDNDTNIVFDRKSMFIVKYNTEGTFQWFQMPEDTAYLNSYHPTIRDLDVAPNGDIYLHSRLVAGTYGGGMFEASYLGSIYDGENIYALKFDSDGNCTGGIHFDLWYSGPSYLVNCEPLRDHHSGKFYMSGPVNQDNSTIIFGGEEVTAENYLVQFDPDGNVNWRVSTDDIGIGPTGFVGKPTTDELGNVYVTGYSYNNNSIGDFTFFNNIATNGFSIFAKMDSMGNVVSASNASSSNDNSGLATAYTNNQVGVSGTWVGQLSWGNIDVVNTDSQGFDIYLSLFDSEGDGTPDSFHSPTSSPLGVERPTLLTADRQGNFYVGGHFSGTVDIGDGTIYNQTGPQEGFIAKFGTDSCYCPVPEAAFSYDSIPNQAEYIFEYTGTAEVDSVVWDFGDGTTGMGISLEHLFAQTDTYTVCVTAYNECGPDSSCITFDALGPVGVKDINGFEEIQVYPNPAHDVLTIGNAAPGTRLAVFNAVGQQMQITVLYASPAQIDVSGLPPGVYLLQLSDGDDKVGYGRFVKE